MWIFLPLLLSLAPPAFAEVVDRVLVVVEDNELIMISEVRLEESLQGLDASPSPFWTHETAMDRLVHAAVVRIIAGDLALYHPDPADVAKRVEAIRLKFDGRPAWEAFLAAHGVDELSLGIAIRRRIIVERYFSRNVAVAVADRPEWLAACHALLEQLEKRVRVRIIEERGPDGG